MISFSFFGKHSAMPDSRNPFFRFKMIVKWDGIISWFFDLPGDFLRGLGVPRFQTVARLKLPFLFFISMVITTHFHSFFLLFLSCPSFAFFRKIHHDNSGQYDNQCYDLRLGDTFPDNKPAQEYSYHRIHICISTDK
jgi:hypothetical protein